MHLCLLAVLTLISAKAAGDQFSPGNPAFMTLKSLRGRYRPLLVFAPSAQFRAYQDQVQSITLQAHGLAERDIVFVPVLIIKDDHISSASPRETALKRVALDPDNEAKVRHEFHVDRDDFAVILVGKDGGEKFRQHTPLTFDRLRDIVDAMPMRQQEMGARHLQDKQK